MMPRTWPELLNGAGVLLLIALAVLECWWAAAIGITATAAAAIAVVRRESQ